MPEFDEFGIPIKKSTPEVEVDEFGIPLKKKEVPNQKPVSVGSKPLPQDGGLSPFISKPKEEKLKGFGEVGVAELEKQGVVQPPPPMRIEPTIDPNVTQQLREQKTQEDIARETKVDTKRNEYNFVKAFKSGVDDFKRAEDIFTDLIAVDVTGDPTPLINRMEQEYAEYKKRGVVNKYEETPAAYVANLFGNQAITIAGALGTSALLSPIVGIAYGGIAAGSQSAGATFEQDYYELRDKGLSPEEAYKQAYELAQTSLGFGAIEGTAGAFVPAGKLATGVKEATKQVAKDALFDVSIATVAQGAQNEIEANKGLSRELTDGMVENATGEAVFSIIMGSFVKGREVLKNKPKVLYELSQAPEEVIQADLEARVENGVATPEEAEAAMQDIIQYKDKLTKVPDNFTDEQKQKSVELITQRDELQASIEGKDEALVKPQKEQIENINTQLEQIANEPITRDEIRGTDAVEESVGEQPAISKTGVEETVTEEVVLPEKTQKRINELNEQRRNQIDNLKILFIDNPTEKERAVRRQERIDEINQEYDIMINDIISTSTARLEKKNKEAQEKYANEKPSPTQMDVGEQARDGEEMGKRNPQEEITQEGEEEIDAKKGNIERRKQEDFNNENESYRVIVGDAAFDDIVENGVVRTNAETKGKKEGGIDLSNRPTAYPSFSKGKASMGYAAENPNNYIIVTEDSSIQPSKVGRHGKGTTMFPTDENGNHLKELSGEKIKVYKHIGNGEYILVYANGKVINAKYDAESAGSESQAKPLQTEVESKAKAELEPEIKSNLEKIQEETGTNFREIQNVYNKYGEGKPLNEITVEDYRRAEAKRQAEKEPTEKQIADTAQKAGITPQNLRDLYKINRELFGLDRIKSLASAIAMDKMVGVMAKRANITKAEMYGRLKFEKASEQDLPQGVKFQVDAWHGSPYEFDKFELSKIGTGEGAQAFGWGLYFTDLESISEQYAKMRKDDLSFLRNFESNGVKISDLWFEFREDSSNVIRNIINGNLDRAVNTLEKLAESLRSELNSKTIGESLKDGLKEQIDLTQKAVDGIKKGNYTKTGVKYKVSIHKGKTPEQYTWLEWDKPVSKKMVANLLLKLNVEKSGLYVDFLETKEKQEKVNAEIRELQKEGNKIINENKATNEEISEYLNKIGSKKAELKYTEINQKAADLSNQLRETRLGRNFVEIAEDGLNGGDFYKFLEGISPEWKEGVSYDFNDQRGAKWASLFLLENGIDGVKYPAESISRGATSDTARGFNYVVFDENAVSIEEVIKFQKDAEKARGAMMISMDGQAVIYALTDPNVSTPLHEMAHVFEHYMTDAEKAIVQSWAGTKGWTTQTSEKFARGFEKYLAEGKAPTSGLQKIFNKFKTWLTEIYNGITGSDIDIELNEPMREIYAKMLGVEAVKTQKTKSAPKVVTSETIKEIVPEKTIEAVKALTRAKKAMTETARTKVEETAKDAPNFDKAKYIMDNLENIKAKLLESGKLTTDCKWG